MLEEAARLLAEADTFVAIDFMNRQADPSAVADAYADLIKRLRHDVPAVVAVGRAGIQNCLAWAAALEEGDPELALHMRGRAKAMAYNVASFTWPGWNDPGIEISAGDMAQGRDCARTNLRLAQELDKGDLALSRAHWVIGAHLLAAGDLEGAQAEFKMTEHLALSAGEASEAQLARGYQALTRRVARPDDAEASAQMVAVQAQLAASEHGDFFVTQLETALRVFATG